jgi:hypothetical protein
MQTSSHLAMHPAVSARPLTPFEQTLASGTLIYSEFGHGTTSRTANASAGSQSRASN